MESKKVFIDNEFYYIKDGGKFWLECFMIILKSQNITSPEQAAHEADVALELYCKRFGL